MAGVAENDGLGTVLRAGRRLDAECVLVHSQGFAPLHKRWAAESHRSYNTLAIQAYPRTIAQRMLR